MDLSDILKVTGVGAGSTTAVVAWVFVKELVVPGSRYQRDTDQLRKERDAYKAEADAAHNRLLQFAGVVEKQSETIRTGIETVKQLTEKTP